MAKTNRNILSQLVEDLRAAHGENLASVVLYGSTAAGDRDDARSDHNILIALKRITTDDLRLSQQPMDGWRRLGQPMPVYFTVEELERAADVFPIEFLQMEQARKVLYGRDPFEYLQISEANLRRQAEYELRTKLIQLRRLYIPASASVEKLAALMSDSLASFAALFRAVLILRGQKPPVTKPEIVHAIVRLLELDASPFDRIFEMRANGKSPLSLTETNAVFGAYMDQIEHVIEVIDRLESE